MSDYNKVLIFGSFTEDERRLYQTQSNVKSYVRPSEEVLQNASETVELQFGSLDISCLNSIKGSGAQPKPTQASHLVSSNDSKSPDLVSKDIALENRNTSISNGLQRTAKPQEKVIADNGKVILDLVRRFERSKDSSELIHNSDLVKPAVEVQNKQKEHALPARSLLPRGLINLGNLCFLNATLQALLSCSPFVQLLQNLCSLNVPKIGHPTLNAFVEFFSHFWVPDETKAKKLERGYLESGRPFSPVMFDPVLKNFTPDIPTSLSGRPRQEDAQEFLSFVMDRMHDELLKLDGGHFSSSNGGRVPLVSSSEDDVWETVGPKNKSTMTRTQSFIPSELSAIFGGQLRSVVKAQGNKASATVQPFLLLHLDILPDAVHTIEDALHLYSAPETLEGYRASAGKAGVVSASMSVKIQTLSKILILHLMRFSYGNNGSAKLLKPVHFPLELILARDLLVTPSLEGRKYELMATITHHGQEPSKGHYTADAQHSDGRWLRYDDSSVIAVGPNRVMHDQAYVLFYKQV